MTPTSSRRARTIILLLMTAAAIGAAVVLSRRLLAPTRPPGGGEPAAATRTLVGRPAGGVEVTAATGTVEAQHEGRWVPVTAGDTLASTDVVRTAPGATAVLRLNVGTEIELRPGVEIGLGALGEDGAEATASADAAGPSGSCSSAARLNLRRGRLLARVAGNEELAVTARDTRTTNAGPARFVVQADERGRVSVAALAGNARFTAAGTSVTVPEGTTTSAAAGAPPQDPEQIPAEVLLNVVWPMPERHDAETEISGRAAPASTITVRSGDTAKVAAAGPDGRFKVVVPLRPGKTPVEIEAEDLTGRTRQVSTNLSRRGPPPSLKPESTDLWKRNAP
jgi:hypothetical protein